MVRLGSWITVPHPSIVDLMAGMPFDWLCVDMEHSPTSALDLVSAVALIQNKGKRAFVRVAENSHTSIKYPLDSGVDGIIVPMINSAEDARRAMDSIKYPPTGKRGVGLARAQNYGFGFENYLKRSQSLEIIFQIEHIKAVEQIDEILALDGINGVFVGPYDLSGSMGIPGQFDHPSMKEAISLVASKTLSAKKLLGIHVIPCEHQLVNDYIDIGYNFIAFSIDTYFLGRKLTVELEALGRFK